MCAVSCRIEYFLFSDEIKIILAGPIFNFVVVIFCYLMFWFEPQTYAFLNDILTANLSILLFNILPIFPLDFGRVLLAYFSKKYSRSDAIKIVKKLSLVFIIILFAIFLISFFFEYNFSLGFVCVNLVRLLFSSSKDTSYKRNLFVNRKINFLNKGKALLDKTIYVKNSTAYYQLFKYIDDSHLFKFIFLDDDGNIVEKLTELELYKRCKLI